jgi:hypothetical protein
MTKQKVFLSSRREIAIQGIKPILKVKKCLSSTKFNCWQLVGSQPLPGPPRKRAFDQVEEIVPLPCAFHITQGD